jgi:hypothetical protein
MNIFDFIKSINEKTGYLFSEDNQKDYNSHIVNTGFSFFPDTLFLANEANKLGLTGQKHYDFLYYAVDQRKRYSKWHKKLQNEKELEAVSEFFDVSLNKSEDMLKALTSDTITEIQNKMMKGGTS